MKRYGIPSKVAAAIKPVASSGGQIMPSIIGTTIFIITDCPNMAYIVLIAVGLILLNVWQVFHFPLFHRREKSL